MQASKYPEFLLYQTFLLVCFCVLFCPNAFLYDSEPRIGFLTEDGMFRPKNQLDIGTKVATMPAKGTMILNDDPSKFPTTGTLFRGLTENNPFIFSPDSEQSHNLVGAAELIYDGKKNFHI